MFEHYLNYFPEIKEKKLDEKPGFEFIKTWLEKPGLVFIYFYIYLLCLASI